MEQIWKAIAGALTVAALIVVAWMWMVIAAAEQAHHFGN
jgi:hypothetical protein